MKTGAIISVAGKVPDNWSNEDEQAFRKQISIFDSVRIITPKINYPFMMKKIWFDLIASGVTDIAIIEAEFNDGETLTFKSPVAKLSMIGLN